MLALIESKFWKFFLFNIQSCFHDLDYVSVWIVMKAAVRLFFRVLPFIYLFILFSCNIWLSCPWTMHLCTVHEPQISFFSNLFIKNGSHDTIHTFKNYFATVFLVSVFSFCNNKFNPNGPYITTPIVPCNTELKKKKGYILSNTAHKGWYCKFKTFATNPANWATMVQLLH